MMHPSESETTRFRAVRDGQVAPVMCDACGCRLEFSAASESPTWFHFGRFGGRDARGCRVDCIELEHDAFGFARTPVPA